MEKQVKTNVDVGGVILTDEAIAQLKQLQEHENESIRVCRETMADAICLITLIYDHFQDKPTKKKAIRTITDLSYIREYFDDLKKP